MPVVFLSPFKEIHAEQRIAIAGTAMLPSVAVDQRWDIRAVRR
jgi:hypothetical protein